MVITSKEVVYSYFEFPVSVSVTIPLDHVKVFVSDLGRPHKPWPSKGTSQRPFSSGRDLTSVRVSDQRNVTKNSRAEHFRNRLFIDNKESFCQRYFSR